MQIGVLSGKLKVPNVLLFLSRAFGVLTWETVSLGEEPFSSYSYTEIIEAVRDMKEKLEIPSHFFPLQL